MVCVQVRIGECRRQLDERIRKSGLSTIGWLVGRVLATTERIYTAVSG